MLVFFCWSEPERIKREESNEKMHNFGTKSCISLGNSGVCPTRFTYSDGGHFNINCHRSIASHNKNLRSFKILLDADGKKENFSTVRALVRGIGTTQFGRGKELSRGGKGSYLPYAIHESGLGGGFGASEDARGGETLERDTDKVHV